MGLQHSGPADLKATWDFNLSNHKPTDEGIEKIEKLRAAAKAFANVIIDETPYSRDQSLAFTALEEALFHANAAVARTHTDDPKPE